MPQADGLQLSKQTITPTCRANRGMAGAWEEAVQRLRQQYDSIKSRADFDQCDVHLLLTLDTPRHKQRKENQE